jgi:cyanate permease
VPSKVRSGAIGIIMALAHCGTAIGFGASPAIIQGLGWGWTFYLFGGASLLWLVSWAHMERDRGTNTARATAAAFINFNRRKAESGAAIVEAAAAAVARQTGSNNIVSSARLSAALRPVVGDGADSSTSSNNKAAATAQHPILEALEQQQQQQEAALAAAAAAATQQPAAASVPYGFWPLMRRREVWAIAVAQYAAGWGFYGLLAWLPQFFIQHLGVSLSQLGGFTLAPYLAQVCVCLFVCVDV